MSGTIKKTLGGDRLGSGNKMDVYLHNFERSTHDLSKVVRTTMGVGTLVPIYSNFGLPGDTFDFDLETMVRTLPTVGPLFGSFKLQVDFFQVPVKLYLAGLHMNLFNVGLQMDKMYLPMMEINYRTPKGINASTRKKGFEPSSLMTYLGIRGGGNTTTSENDSILYRNALMLLSYWDIYKQYYSNRAEKRGYYIRPKFGSGWQVSEITYEFGHAGNTITINAQGNFSELLHIEQSNWDRLILKGADGYISVDTEFIDTTSTYWRVDEIGAISHSGNDMIITNDGRFDDIRSFHNLTQGAVNTPEYGDIAIDGFDLENIDEMKKAILQKDWNSPFIVNKNSIEPYGMCVGMIQHGANKYFNNEFSQNGSGIKTYQSDMFNNWISDDWVTGANSISALTGVDVSSGVLNLDRLNFAKKLYNMLNRVMASGGSYEDRTEAVYGHSVARRMETPMYVGGLSREIIFEEVVSMVEKDPTLPLGTLGGKGNQSENKKGGRFTVKVDDECIIMGIASITPRIDVSQGNKWFTNLETMDDFHKPSLDGIGFQQLITEQMLCTDGIYNPATKKTQFFSAGFQPSWLNYMTDIGLDVRNLPAICLISIAISVLTKCFTHHNV